MQVDFLCVLCYFSNSPIFGIEGGLPIGKRRRRPTRYEPRIKTNRQIRAREVRVIGSKGEQRGLMDTRDAVKEAQEQGLDLVEIAPTENPPVCRIMDFGKYLYLEKKKKRDSKKKQTRVEVKECKFRPKIGKHDFDVRVRRAVKFLGQGNKVKLTVMFRGREHAHPEIAERLIMRAFEEVKDLGKMEAPPRKEGRDMHTLIAPLPEAIRKKALKARGILVEDKDKKDKDKKDSSKETIKSVEEIEETSVDKGVEEVIKEEDTKDVEIIKDETPVDEELAVPAEETT